MSGRLAELFSFTAAARGLTGAGAWDLRAAAAVSAPAVPAPAAASAPGPAAERTRVRTYVPRGAAAFVFVALLALGALPAVTFRQIDALREQAAATTNPAAEHLSELRVLLSDEVVAHQSARTGADSTMGRYQAARAREDLLLAEVARLAPHIGIGVPARVAALRRVAARWHAPADARASGRMSEAAFRAALPRVHDLRDSVIAAEAALTTAVQQADARLDARAAHAARRQGRASLALGVLAALAALVVAGFVGHERRLARALAQAAGEETRLRAESERQREALVALDASKGRLVRGFTHDVKNPIGAADGYLQLLEDGIPEAATPLQRRSLARARRSLGAALALIDDLLEASRADSGAVEVRPVPTDLAAVAREVADEFRARAAAKGLRLEVRVDDPVPLVQSDPVRVRQVLGNLVSNAVKYTERGGVEVRLRGTAAGGAVMPARYAIEVADTGPGIAADQQGRLFEEYVRLDPTAAPGVGIGLAISRRIARALGGDLGVRSRAGEGSTFVLWLPAS